MNKYVLLLVCVATLSFHLQAEENHRVEKEEWVVGFSLFRALNLDEDSDYLTHSLPLLLQEQLSDIQTHSFNEAEKLQLSELYLKNGLLELQQERSNLYTQRDNLLFSRDKDEIRQSRYQNLTEELSTLDSEIVEWNELLIDDVEVVQDSTVIFRNFESVESRLLPERRQLKVFLEKEELDLLIFGSIEKLDEYYFVTIGVYQKDRETILLEEAALEEDMSAIIDEAANKLRTIILGRQWAALSIKTVPETALIRVNGESVGVGSAEIKSLEPGFVTINAEQSGYQSRHLQEYLPPSHTMQHDIYLKEGGTDDVLYIFSDPPGADVYGGSLWLGTTPLFMNKSSENQRLKISHENYMPFYIAQNEILSESITVQLGYDLYDRSENLKTAKKNFYSSLGWFSLSLGIPLVLNGVYKNFDNRYNTNKIEYFRTLDEDYLDEANKYGVYGDVAYYGFLGGVTLSSALLVNVFVKLKDYIKAGEESTEE